MLIPVEEGRAQQETDPDPALDLHLLITTRPRHYNLQVHIIQDFMSTRPFV